MSGSKTLRLQFAPELNSGAVLAGLLGLSGRSDATRRFSRLIASGTANGIEHLFVPASDCERQHFASHLDGVQLVEHEPLPTPRFSWQLWLSSGRRPLALDRAEMTTRALLSALSAPMGRGESLRLEWLLGPVRRPQAVGANHAPLLSESWTRALATAAFAAPGDLDADARRSLRTKYALPGWKAAGFITVDAESRKRAQQLAAGVLAALRTADGPSAHFGIRRGSTTAPQSGPWFFNLRLSSAELVGLLGYPIGAAGAGFRVAQRRARLLPAPLATRREGQRLIGRSVIGDHPVYQTQRAANMHTYCLGPTGSGKTNWLVSQALNDILSGQNLVFVDAKGGAVDEILARYPRARDDDLVIISPQDKRPVGINPFTTGSEPALAADQLLNIFSRLYVDAWGPRTADVMHAGLLTLAQLKSGSLALLPILLTNEAFRRQAVGQLNDPLGVGPFWDTFNQLTPDMQRQWAGPTLTRIRPFLARPSLRGALAQAEPRFNLSDVFSQSRVVLIDLAKGRLGPEASALMGTVLLNMLWQSTLSRSGRSTGRMRSVSLYVDEAQDFVGRLPVDLGDMLAQARSLKLAVTLAHQHLSQLPPDLREAALSGARSRVIFQVGSRDAQVLAQGHPELTPHDLVGLPRYEVYASLVVTDEATPYASVRSLELPRGARDVEALRAVSAERYGRDRAETDRALEALAGRAPKEAPIGERRRRNS